MSNETKKPGFAPKQATTGHDNKKPSHRSNFSFIDLLLVIAIVICLVFLLVVPAIQSARESSRREQCIGNLQKLTQATLSHRNVTLRYPTGGWGWRWVGDPDRGNDEKQPGGWAYNVLPYMDRQALHDMSKGGNEKQKKYETAHMISTLLPEHICPSRRVATLYPYIDLAHNSARTKVSAHTDYAINRGDVFVYGNEGPQNFDDKKYQWPDTKDMTGLSHLRSMVQTKDITDGISNTYLLGEKWLDSGQYLNGQNWGDNGCVYVGDDYDIARNTGLSTNTPLEPMPDGPPMNMQEHIRFGSAHPTTWQASFCDGAIRSITFDIDPELHRKLGNRKDGEKINPDSIPTE